MGGGVGEADRGADRKTGKYASKMRATIYSVLPLCCHTDSGVLRCGRGNGGIESRCRRKTYRFSRLLLTLRYFSRGSTPQSGDSAFSFAFAHFGDTVGAGRTRAVCAANRAGGEAAATPYSAKRNTARAPRVWEFLLECAWQGRLGSTD